jgi:hypothetical protein
VDALTGRYGALGSKIDPSGRYQLVEAAGEVWAVSWPERSLRLPAAFHGHTLRFKQSRLGWQLPGRAPELGGVFADLDELRDRLAGLPLADTDPPPTRRGWRALDF